MCGDSGVGWFAFLVFLYRFCSYSLVSKYIFWLDLVSFRFVNGTNEKYMLSGVVVRIGVCVYVFTDLELGTRSAPVLILEVWSHPV